MPQPQDGLWPKVPKPVENWFKLESKAGEKRARLHVFGPVGGWFGLNVHQLVRDLDALDVDHIDAHIDSGGGDAFGGIALRNALRRHKASVTVRVDGLAASAASIIAMGADEVVMSPGSQMMVHEASGARYGRAADMTAAAKALENMNAQMAEMYAEKSGGAAADWREAMRVESWYSATEAVDAGLADRAEESKNGEKAEDLDPIENRYDLAMCAYAGRAKAPRPIIPTTSTTPVVAASPAPGDETQPKEHSMAFMDEVRQRLGADAGADEAAILAALDDLKNKPTMPEGAVAVDAEVWEATRAQVAELAEREQAREGERIVAVVDQAIRDGRTTPARRNDWIEAIKADAGSEQTLMSLAKGLLVNVEAKGYTGGVDESSDEDVLYARIFSKEA